MEHLQKSNPAAGGMTDGELIEEFCLASDRQPTTIMKYRTHLVEFSSWLPADRPILSATRRDVVRFMTHLKSDQRGALSAPARKGFLSALRVFWRHAGMMEYVDAAPTLGVPMPRVHLRRGLTITRAQLRRFLDAPGRSRDRISASLAWSASVKLRRYRR
jgi:site-specific recombinase XerD